MPNEQSHASPKCEQGELFKLDHRVGGIPSILYGVGAPIRFSENLKSSRIQNFESLFQKKNRQIEVRSEI